MPLAIDLFCGLGGWTEGLLAEGYDVAGFDIERHEYVAHHRYPGMLAIQDALTLHGSQFRNATLIVASPPCQEYSYMAMPWKLAKAKAKAIRDDTTGESLAALNRLFNACFRIQAEASLAAGRHIPMVVENVRGAIPWVGRSRWNFGSFHLWGDVPALMPVTFGRQVMKAGIAHRPNGETNFHGHKVGGTDISKVGFNVACVRKFAHGDPNVTMADGRKHDGSGWRENGTLASCNRMVPNGIKCGGDWFGPGVKSTMRCHSSKSTARKMASAMIAKIPLPLSRHIAATFRPRDQQTRAA